SGPQHRRHIGRRARRSEPRRNHRARRRSHVPGEARCQRPALLSVRWRYSPPMQSHASADTDPANWLAALARQHPDRLLLKTPDGQRGTSPAMNRRVDRVAAALAQRAVVAGDRVVAQVEKSPDAIALYLACLRVGAAFVPLNTAYTSAEIEYFLGNADPKVAVGVDGGVSLAELTYDESEQAQAHADLRKSDLAALLYTSGTT